jgi:hypothetical protein
VGELSISHDNIHGGCHMLSGLPIAFFSLFKFCIVVRGELGKKKKKTATPTYT